MHNFEAEDCQMPWYHPSYRNYDSDHPDVTAMLPIQIYVGCSFPSPVELYNYYKWKREYDLWAEEAQKQQQENENLCISTGGKLLYLLGGISSKQCQCLDKTGVSWIRSYDYNCSNSSL